MSHSDPDATIDAILPAGGRISGEYARIAGNEVKALLKFGENSILQRSVAALRQLPSIGKIVVVGPVVTHADAMDAGADATLIEGHTGPDNIYRGVDWLTNASQPALRCLILTTDMPFITSQALESFLGQCDQKCDVSVPVVERNLFERVYPGLIRTDTHLRDGWVRLGGAFLLRSATLQSCRDKIDALFAARKNNLQLAKLIGLRVALSYATGRLTSQHIVERASQILGCKGEVVWCKAPELGFDVDLLEEYEYAVQHWA